MPPSAVLRLPPPHSGGQDKFFYWSDLNPKAQVLVAPCGVKTGKTFGCALWMAKEAVLNPKLYCVWISPTYKTAMQGYRYMKHMLNIPGVARPVDGKLTITLFNGSRIVFCHGSNAEVTIEGEAVDRFVIDESGKIQKQVWFSLLTTITQTRGIGIVTGTPRGFTWYYDIFRLAKDGDQMFDWTHLRTVDSPYTDKAHVARAKRLLSPSLYSQYYLAQFVSHSGVFGDLSGIWTGDIVIPSKTKYWIHPDPAERAKEMVHGLDLAKKRDYTVLYSVNVNGTCTGYCRFNQTPYQMQTQRIETYLKKYFSHAADNTLRYDATGVGDVVGELLADMDFDIGIDPIIFTNDSKSNMVTALNIAVDEPWLKSPRLEQAEHEMGSYEVRVTKTGKHSYNAMEGSHDDVVSAMMLAVSGAYRAGGVAEAEELMKQLAEGSGPSDILDYVSAAHSQDDSFFNDPDQDDEDFQFEGTYG